jgi:hypothetical protein
VKYTYFGDADLDALVSTNDYFQIDNVFTGNKTGWINGDFDGAVTTNDYFLIDSAFTGQGEVLVPAAATSNAALRGQTAVTEPAAFPTLSVAATSVLTSRKCRRFC